MKNIALLLLLCVSVFPRVSGQETSFEEKLSPHEAENFYLQRAHDKNRTAKGLLFGGLGVVAVGALLLDKAEGNNGLGEAFGGATLFLVGGISTLVSIPFFIKAGSYKRKAKEAKGQMNVTLGTIRSPQRQDLGVGLSYSF